MAIARVQFNHAEASGFGTSIGTTLAGIGAGRLLVESVGGATASTTTSVTDDLSVAAVLAAAAIDIANAQYREIWYHKNHGGGSRTVTVNYAATNSFRSIVLIEYSGADTAAPLEGTASNTGTSATPTSTNVSPTPTQNGSLIVGAIASANLPTFAAPFSNVFQDSTTFADTEDLIQTTAAAIAATWTMTSGTYGAVAAVFKPGAAAPGGGWLSRGSRQAPGAARGPFDQRGMLLHRQYDYTPSTVAVQTTVPTAVVWRAISVAPTMAPGTATDAPVSVVWRALAVTPTLAPGSLTSAQAAVVARWIAVAPTVTNGAASMTPAAAVVRWLGTAPTLAAGGVTFTQTAVVARWATVLPTLANGAVVQPAAVAARWAGVAPTLAAGSASRTPVAGVIRIAAVTPALTVPGAGATTAKYFRYAL